MNRAPICWRIFSLGMAFFALTWYNSVPQVSADEQPIKPQEQLAQIGHGVLARPPISVVHGYSSLPQMINQVCEEASTQFNDFFGPSAVKVKPFSVIDEFIPRKFSLLGVTLADQMAARINTDGNEQASAKGPSDQLLEGVIHELNGYLRVHMSGLNSRGERRSYVVNVEMSEPVYRALHTLVATAE